jgi:hypothetical protein
VHDLLLYQILFVQVHWFGHAMAQVVSHQPVTVEAKVSSCGLYGGQSGTGTGFSLSSLVFLYHYHSTMVLHTLTLILR